MPGLGGIPTGMGNVATAGETAPTGGGSGWIADRSAAALRRVPTLNRFHGSDLLDGEYFLGGGAFAPTPSNTISNGVYNLPGGAGFGWVQLGKTDAQVVIAQPKTESWYIASRIKNPAAAIFTAAKDTIAIGL